MGVIEAYPAAANRKRLHPPGGEGSPVSTKGIRASAAILRIRIFHTLSKRFLQVFCPPSWDNPDSGFNGGTPCRRAPSLWGRALSLWGRALSLWGRALSLRG
jgi:hypothetical protein